MDAITHRFEMPAFYSVVRVRRDSPRTWDYAISGASKRVRSADGVAARSRAGLSFLRGGAPSDLQPAILEPRVRGTESASRQLSDKLSRRAGISSGAAVRGGRGAERRRTPSRYI